MLCPICKREVEAPAKEQRGQNRPAGTGSPRSHFPFCSERCKLIDLGRWLGGKYQIPVVERDESDEDAPPVDESRRGPRR